MAVISSNHFFSPHNRFFRMINAGEIKILISPLVIAELIGAPQEVRDLYRNLPLDVIEEISFSSSAFELAEKYFAAGFMRKSSREDALHIALATVGHAELIVSWNFKDLVNIDAIRGFNAVNLQEGYGMIDIRSPLEVISDDDARQL
jgi:hypothetical protein